MKILQKNSETLLKTWKYISTQSFNDKVKWGYMKFEIRKFTISYRKIWAKNNWKMKKDLETKLKDLKIDLNKYRKFQKYNKLNPNFKKLWNIYTWYKEGEKFKKLFLNLEKKRILQVQIRKFIFFNQEIMGQNKMGNELQLFNKNYFKSNCTKSYNDCIKFLDNIITLVLTNGRKS